jgi:hypothetical protein
VSQLGAVLFSLFLSFNSSVTASIEKAFLQNNPGLLYPLLSTTQPIAISLPAPISFSDQLSAERAFFLFQRTFRTYTTFEFFPDTNVLGLPEKGRAIFQARWSFLNKNKNQYVFQIFFFIRNQPSASRLGDVWRITEIKAERL